VGQHGLKDNSKVFNTARIEALEVDNLIEAAQATMVAAARKECRGAHTVRDYERDADHPSPAGPQRRQLDEAHAVVQARQPPGPTSR
jgi:aspartate oxidase